MAENLNRHIASTSAAEDEVPAFVSLSKLLCLHLFKSDDWSLFCGLLEVQIFTAQALPHNKCPQFRQLLL